MIEASGPGLLETPMSPSSYSLMPHLSWCVALNT